MGDAAEDAERRAWEEIEEFGQARERVAPPVVARMPTTWAEVDARLAEALGGPGNAYEWVTQAVVATFGAPLVELRAGQRALALQKAIGTLYGLEEIGDGGMLPFHNDPRSEIRAVFARYWGGIVLEGPPWRLAPGEARPREGDVSSDFDFMEETN